MTESRIIWIASYPKSGNTWVRFLLANMLFGHVKTSADIEAMVPDVHRADEIKAQYHVGGTVFLKTHWALQDKMPQREKTAAAIHIVRHPLDVLRSHIDYMGLAEDDAKRGLFIDAFVASGGAPAWQKRGYGSWISNLHSWYGARQSFPMLNMKYEDVKADPAAAVQRIATFFQLEPDASEVMRIVDASSFERMRELEVAEIQSGAEGFFQTERGHSNDPNFRFMRAGSVGGYRDFLSGPQLAAAKDRFGEIAEQLGYEL